MRNVIVDVYTSSGSTFTFDDSVAPNAGGTAYTQLRNDEDVDSIYDDGGNLTEVYIPLHSIAAAYVTYEEDDNPFDDICKEGSSIDCTRVVWKRSANTEIFDPISEGDTIQMRLRNPNYYFICSLDQTTLVEPTYTCDMASATFEYSNDMLHFEPTQTGTAHITLDYMGCKISFTVEVV